MKDDHKFYVEGFSARRVETFALKTTPYAVKRVSFHQTLTSATSHMIYRDAITTNLDFLICAHPHCMNIFTATGGSFHAWKSLLILGEYGRYAGR
jgi:hypothetical protein